MAEPDKFTDKMKWDMCKCEASGLVRPRNGPVRIKETDVLHDDLLVAKLSGPAGGTAYAVREGKKFFFVGADKNEIREVPADSLTDALHAGIFMKNEELKAKKKVDFKRRDMPKVELKGAKKRSH